MCSVAGWSGQIPVSLLSNLLNEMGVRGRDSTGLAFRTSQVGPEGEKRITVGYKMAVDPKDFVKATQDELAAARKSHSGIAHTRRASPGMPIDNDNAHPYAWENYVYAHNGRIENWRDIKKSYLEEMDGEQKKKVEKFTTDSMVIGPAIEVMDFSELKGCMAIVWIEKEKVHAVTSAKELVAAKITMTWTDPKETLLEGIVERTQKSLIFSVFCSTEDIMNKSMDEVEKKWNTYTNVADLKIETKYTELSSGIVYQLNENSDLGFDEIQKVAMHAGNSADVFSSTACAVVTPISTYTPSTNIVGPKLLINAMTDDEWAAFVGNEYRLTGDLD